MLASRRVPACFFCIPMAHASISLVHKLKLPAFAKLAQYCLPVKSTPEFAACAEDWSLTAACRRLAANSKGFVLPHPQLQTASLGCGLSSSTFRGLKSRAKCQRDTFSLPWAEAAQMRCLRSRLAAGVILAPAAGERLTRARGTCFVHSN